MKSFLTASRISRPGSVRLIAAAGTAVIAALAMIGCSGEGDSAGKSVPFKGSAATTMTFGRSPDCATDQLFVQATGSGNATELDKYSVVQSHCGYVPGDITNGKITFTAANGDSLNATYKGKSTPASAGVLAVAVEGTITGGTGRFAGAGGTVNVTATANPATMEMTFTHDGTITSVGASKK